MAKPSDNSTTTTNQQTVNGVVYNVTTTLDSSGRVIRGTAAPADGRVDDE